jgi:small subunit ribosomal protein S1
LKKEDGSQAKVEETLDFKVIEFNKEAKKIVVSHTRLFEEGTDKPATPKKGTKGSATDNAVKAVNQTSEKSTLGDIDALAELKEKMEKGK